jgi:hypothetical protein
MKIKSKSETANIVKNTISINKLHFSLNIKACFKLSEQEITKKFPGVYNIETSVNSKLCNKDQVFIESTGLVKKDPQKDINEFPEFDEFNEPDIKE